jgi:PAS domain S-box-containing protein
LLGLLFIVFAPTFTPISQAHAANHLDLFSSPLFFNDIAAPHFQSIALKPEILPAAHWELVQYKFRLTLAALLFLVVILAGLLWLDIQLKKGILKRFYPSSSDLDADVTPFQYPTKAAIFFVMLFLAGLAVLYIIIILTYETYQNQGLVKLLGAIFGAFALFGGYFFGSLKRSKQLEVMINKLQLQIIDKKVVQEQLIQTEQRLQRQNASLAQLATLQLDAWHNPEALFRQIAEVSAQALNVERVSIWQFSNDQKQLECLGLYLNTKNLHTVAKPLQASDLPIYFNHLADNRVLAVDDVMQHAATAEFPVEYLQGNGIGAMLDGTIWLNNEIIGVICHEHVGGMREWTLDEQSFVGSIADLARLTLETHKRLQAEKTLSLQQNNIESIVSRRVELVERNAKLFRFLVERAPVTILYMNAANEIIEMNPEAERVSGYSREFAIGKTYQALFATKENKTQLESVAKQVSFGEKIQSEEIAIRRADGSTVDLSVSRSMELDAEGNPVIISIGQDMSRQKAFERNAQKLLETEKRYSYVIKHAPMPILIINKEGNIVEVNPEAQLAAGYSRDEMIGKQFIQLIVAKESHKKAYASAQRAMNGGDFRSVELTLQNASGDKFEYECSMSMFVQEANDEAQIVAIARDISHQKAIQLSLTRAREAAESADRIKSMFVASMSHELRTPLNSIIGFLSVVLQGMSGELNLKQKDQLGRAYHSAKHLLSLISDVIDISKIEAGFLQVHEEKVYLKQLFVEVQHAVSHLAEEKKLSLDMDCDDKLQLDTDRKRLYQVVLNVVSNALKYSERGSVHVSTESTKGWLAIAVKDTGIGIAEANLAQLFKPFERIESKLKVKTLGTGLGLYLTRKILTQLLGGAIEVKSTLGEGSTFTVKVPLKMPKALKQSNASILEEHQQNHLN